MIDELPAELTDVIDITNSSYRDLSTEDGVPSNYGTENFIHLS